MIETTAVIISNARVARNRFELVLRVKGLKGLKKPWIVPGQFCMISIDAPGGGKILRRPFSIFRRSGLDRVSILYKTAGAGTEILSKKKKGDACSVLLPLGNGFPVGKLGNKHLYIVAGGIGAASVHGLLQVKSKSKKFFYGAASSGDLCPVSCPKNTATFLATDDGSRGHKGFLTDLVSLSVTKDLKSVKGKDIVICACGPMIMLKTLFRVVSDLDPSIRMFFALEERMACGFGVCIGCVVLTDTGYKRTCADGPVFQAETIRWSGK